MTDCRQCLAQESTELFLTDPVVETDLTFDRDVEAGAPAASRAESILPLDILSPDFINEPSEMIDRMHAEAPVFYDERVQGWIVGGHRDVKNLGRESRLSAQRQGYVSALLPEELRERIRTLEEWYGGWMIMRDGADHSRLRRLAVHAFQPRALQRLATRIDELVAKLLESALAKGEFDVLSELAYPLPSRVICEMVGIPRNDLALFTKWVKGMNALLAATLASKEAIDGVAESRREMHEYFSELIVDRRRAPREGELLTDLVQAGGADSSLTADEVINLVALIMSGAYDTTANLIANGVYLLTTHPTQMKAARANPSLQNGIVEEVLRCEPSVAINTRAVAETFDYGDHCFEQGQIVYFINLAANRDPKKFADPHRFDITRTNSSHHVTFGFGSHFCIGALLARMEARAVFRALLTRAPNLQLLQQDLRRVPNMVVRGFEQLKVSTSRSY